MDAFFHYDPEKHVILGPDGPYMFCPADMPDHVAEQIASQINDEFTASAEEEIARANHINRMQLRFPNPFNDN